MNHKFKNGERCRPFALWFAVPWAVSVVLLFCDFKTSQTAAVILALVIYFIFESFNTFVAIPYNSMGGLATNRDADRRSINVYRNLGGCIGSGIGAVACLPLLKLFGALDNGGNLIDGSSSRGFLLTAMVMGAVCIVGSLTHYFTTKERVVQISDDEDHVSARSAAKMLFRCKSWVLNMLYIICYGVNNVLIMSSITYYATYVMGSTGRGHHHPGRVPGGFHHHDGADRPAGPAARPQADDDLCGRCTDPGAKYGSSSTPLRWGQSI